MTDRPATDHDLQAASVTELLAGIVGDAGELMSAHVAAIRDELGRGLRDVRDRTRSIIYAAAAMIVAAIAVNVALASSLVALGAPSWLAAWLVAILAIAVLLLLVRRASGPRRPPHDAGDPAAAIARAGHDAAWLADRATDAIT